MDALLQLWIDLNHPLVQIRVVAHQDFRVPSSGYEEGAKCMSAAVTKMEIDDGKTYSTPLAMGVMNI